MFKKLRNQILIQESKNINLSEDERSKIEIQMIFGSLLESLEASQDIEAMYGESFEKERKSDGHTPESIASLHNVSVQDILDQIEKGIKVEREHTTDEAEARIIAMDHLVELPDYYTRLGKMEEEGKKDLEESSMAGIAGIVSRSAGDHGQPVDIDSEKLKETNKQK